MRCRTAAAAVLVLAATATACSAGPEQRTAGGVPTRWYSAVAKVAEPPKVGSVALLDDGGPCALRANVVVHGRKIRRVSDHGVVRLGGDIPAVSCSWYDDGTQPVEVTVAQAPDAARYARLVAATGASAQVGNVQTQQQVAVGGRTLVVVRTVYPTNPAAGTDLDATLLDQGARGRVSMRVSGANNLQGYDETAVAKDLAAFLAG